MPKRSGTPSTRSVPCALLLEHGFAARARTAAARRSTSPPQREHATAPRRPSGRCRARRPRGSRRGATHRPTTARRRAAGWRACGSRCCPGRAPSIGERRRRDHVGDAVVVLRAEADVEVGAERPGDLLGEERADRCAGDAADDLADEVALRDRVVAGRGARLPPRLLRGEQRRSPSPSRRGPRAASAPASPTGPAVWPAGGGPRRPPCRAAELGPVARDRRVRGRARRGRRGQRAQRRHRLGRRPDVDDRVGFPRRRCGPRRSAAPDVDDGLAVEADSRHSLRRRRRVEAGRQCVAHALEPRIDRAMDLCHVSPLSAPHCRTPRHDPAVRSGVDQCAYAHWLTPERRRGGRRTRARLRGRWRCGGRVGRGRDRGVAATNRRGSACCSTAMPRCCTGTSSVGLGPAEAEAMVGDIFRIAFERRAHVRPRTSHGPPVALRHRHEPGREAPPWRSPPPPTPSPGSPRNGCRRPTSRIGSASSSMPPSCGRESSRR